jgi:HlyD family secretion protein
MQLNASIDESDMGVVRQGQAVSFTVDAYPGETFDGIVDEVRLNPTIVNNVVTYAAIISAPNPQLKLKPGMTATLDIEVARKDGVLRVPAAATRFRPNADVVAALHVDDANVPANAVWVYDEGRATPVRVTFGASDGTWTEVVEANLEEGTQVITRVQIGAEEARPATTNRNGNPLMGATPARR